MFTHDVRDADAVPASVWEWCAAPKRQTMRNETLTESFTLALYWKEVIFVCIMLYWNGSVEARNTAFGVASAVKQ